MEKISTPARPKLGMIQELRALAVILVIIVHATNVVDYRFDHGIDLDRGWFSNPRYLNEFGASGVDLFFVISGFVMAMMLGRASMPGFGGFIRARFMRIVPLYWMVSLCYALLLLIAGEAVTRASLVAAVTVFPASIDGYVSPVLTVGWSLAFELGFYCLVGLSGLAGRHRLLLLAAMVAGLATLSVLMPMPPGLLAVLSNPIQFEFLFGIIAFQACSLTPDGEKARNAGRHCLWLGIIGLLLTIAWGYPFSPAYMEIIDGRVGLDRVLYWGLPWMLVVIGAVLAGRGAEATLAHAPGRGRRMVRFLGDASYSLYLTHMMLCLLAQHYLAAVPVQADALILAIVAAALILGAGCYIWVERPLLLLVRRAGTRRRITPPFRPIPSGPFR